ncbi:MAG: hypothetical protein ACOYNS_02450 [Bacteroidota bacterium]
MTSSIDECDRLVKKYIKTFEVKDNDALNVVAACGVEQAIEYFKISLTMKKKIRIVYEDEVLDGGRIKIGGTFY